MSEAACAVTVSVVEVLGVGVGENRTCVSCVGGSCEAGALVGCSCSLSEEGLVRFGHLRQGSLSDCNSVVGSGVVVSFLILCLCPFGYW